MRVDLVSRKTIGISLLVLVFGGIGITHAYTIYTTYTNTLTSTAYSTVMSMTSKFFIKVFEKLYIYPLPEVAISSFNYTQYNLTNVQLVGMGIAFDKTIPNTSKDYGEFFVTGTVVPVFYNPTSNSTYILYKSLNVFSNKLYAIMSYSYTANTQYPPGIYINKKVYVPTSSVLSATSINYYNYWVYVAPYGTPINQTLLALPDGKVVMCGSICTLVNDTSGARLWNVTFQNVTVRPFYFNTTQGRVIGIYDSVSGNLTLLNESTGAVIMSEKFPAQISIMKACNQNGTNYLIVVTPNDIESWSFSNLTNPILNSTFSYSNVKLMGVTDDCNIIAIVNNAMDDIIGFYTPTGKEVADLHANGPIEALAIRGKADSSYLAFSFTNSTGYYYLDIYYMSFGIAPKVLPYLTSMTSMYTSAYNSISSSGIPSPALLALAIPLLALLRRRK
ncbi:hypothetical protein IPA_06120 [Ignicoccus pacificus DSM 13166]|uniref:Uncharacterized protein n=1 Tax=Ignicoccus pacificus DSM 13166 TaxID=940294 RepID=A0A977PL00_9CREN|nr:hypothetical protein IPA_06120 [Ignicoccus pacificus DSM 13166]